MDWPRTPIDRLQVFRPPFCPRQRCPCHRDPDAFRWCRDGSYVTRRGDRIACFRCRRCRSRFSRKAFSTTYYLKRPELLRPVAAALQAGSAHRQIARTLGCAPSTVTRLSQRLGRHALLLHRLALEELAARLDEPVVLDHFETFELTQDRPFGVATAVGASSWFLYALDPAPHERTGPRSPYQQRRLDQRPPRDRRGGYPASTRRLLDRLLPLLRPGRSLRLVGDGHPAYDRAVAVHPRSNEIRLEQHPNPPPRPSGSPPSPRARRRNRAMFPVDALHALLRHSLAAHKRETIAFGRRLNAILERLFLAAVWRNFVKGVSERRRDPTTPAMRLDLTDQPWSWTRVLARRLFPARVGLDGVWRELYRRDWISPDLPTNDRHRRVFAY